jgi:SEC-C motif-containing protein
MAKRPTACPCGSGATYDGCCGVLHSGAAAAATAEQLMRSRFSAFAVGDAGYLLRTWHSSTRPERLDLDPGQRWVRLDVLDTRRGAADDPAGTVEFRAVYRRAGRTADLHERSRFVREAGGWVYVGPLPT